jgi:hypothetical protein
MSGFSNDEKANVELNMDAINELTKEYKKIKKYMKSPIFQIKMMDGTETKVKKLLEDNEE